MNDNPYPFIVFIVFILVGTILFGSWRNGTTGIIELFRMKQRKDPDYQRQLKNTKGLWLFFIGFPVLAFIAVWLFAWVIIFVERLVG